MSEQEAVIQRMFSEIINDGDLDVADELFAVDYVEMMGIAPTGRSFEYVAPNIGRFSDGKAAEHWADQGMFQFLTQIGVLPMPAA